MTDDDIPVRLRRAVPDGSLLDEAADLIDAERALADDLAYWLDIFVDHDHDEAMVVLARWREARRD